MTRHVAIVSVPAIAGALLLWAGPVLAATFHYTTLDVPGEYLSELGGGVSLNDSDQVVGSTESSAETYQGFLWQKGAFTLFQTCNILDSINAAGLAVGYDNANFGEYCTVTAKTGATHVYPFHRQGRVGLVAVNASGTVLAQNTLPGDRTRGLILDKRHNTAFGILPEVKYGGTFPTGLTDSGTIVGDYTPPGASWNQGFTYTGGNYTMFNVPGAKGTNPFFITASGVIGGEYVSSDPSEADIGFVLSGSTATTIKPPGATSSFVAGVGPGGELVGSWYGSGAGHGFIYSGGVYYQIDVPGAASTTVLHVNALGSLVGTYFDRQGNTHPFIAQCDAGSVCTK